MGESTLFPTSTFPPFAPLSRHSRATLARACVCVCVCVCVSVCVCVLVRGGSERRGSGSISSISSLIRLHRGRVYIR